MFELGLVPFTPSKQHEVAKLEDVFFDPKRKSIVWRVKKTLKIGTEPEVITMTEKMIVKDVEEDLVHMASWGVATAQVNTYNISKIKETVDQYKDRMAQMKDTLRKEERVGRESKRKYDATLSDLEKLHKDY